ncbi:MAG TPA: ABC transporter substrate-binding protein [Gemmatimonadota bacterium]|nr:ABC transporter substrate-binding protein [Gemmatimonadota bacterium]
MTTEVAPFSPIGRRQFMQWCTGSLALAAAGCRRGRDRASSGGCSVTIAYCCGVEDVLNPWEDMSAKFLLFLPLARFNEEGELEGRLAKAWEHSPDYREWTYDLRTDVRWQDGVPFTAHDVKFTLDTLSHPDVQYFGPGFIESTTVVDDATVEIRFGGYPEFFAMATVFYPRHLLSHLLPQRFFQWDFWKRPVGNGPYRFVRRLPKTMMEFEANPDYHRGKPRIDRVVLKFVDEAGLTDLLGGGADAVTFSNPAQIPKLGNDPRFRVYHRLFELVSRAIYWNHAHPPFDDVRVRRALTLAINRRELLRVLNLPESFPVVDGIYTDRQLRRGQLPEPLPYDPAQARELLEAAGWRDLDGDGVRERGGKAFRFTAILPGAAGFTEWASTSRTSCAASVFGWRSSRWPVGASSEKGFGPAGSRPRSNSSAAAAGGSNGISAKTRRLATQTGRYPSSSTGR